MSASRELCNECSRLLFQQPPEGNSTHHSSGQDLKTCAESRACNLCAVVWHRCSSQQQSDLAEALVQDVDDGDEASVQCSYDGKQLSFTLPIPYKIREETYGSSMSQTIDISVELSVFGNATQKSYPDTTFSDDMAIRARSWVEDCIKNHAHSKLAPPNQFQPTRLVDVGTIEQPRIRVCETQEFSDKVEYITLSHRWGTGKILMLKLGNKDALMKSIEPDQLSKTFNDAIKITRRLGIQYVWIDSLCIIQDSLQDWSKEAATMADCYDFAYCTISASGSGDHDLGMILDRNANLLDSLILDLNAPEASQPQKSSAVSRFMKSMKQAFKTGSKPEGHLLPIGTYVCKDVQAWRREVDGSPLNRRGWIYQERMLSSRILHFGRTRVYFECFNQQCSEDRPEQVDKDIFAEVDFKQNSPHALYVKLESHPDECARHAPDIWAMTVAYYSRCPLTRGTDRLPALGGVAQRYKKLMALSERTEQPAIKCTNPDIPVPEYFQGIWLQNKYAIQSLCWGLNCKPELRDKELQNMVPSWSFGSLTSEISFGPISVSVSTSDEATDLARIVMVDVVPKAGIDNALEHAKWLGQIESGTGALWLEGVVIPCQLSTEALRQAAKLDEDDARRLLRSAGTDFGNPILVINDESLRWSSTVDELRTGTADDNLGWSGEYFIMALCKKTSEQRIYGIILERVDQGNGCYRRVGSFSLDVQQYSTMIHNELATLLDSRLHEARLEENRIRIKVI